MLTLDSEVAAAQGGAIYAASTLTVTNCTLIGNKADGGFGGGFAEGGGIEAYGGLTAANCILIGNESIGGSGATNEGSCGFFAGYALGGGINVEGIFVSTVATANITDSTLIGNQAVGGAGSSGRGGFGDGGGVDANFAALDLENSSLIGNGATGGRGGPGADGGSALGGGIDVEDFSTAEVTATNLLFEQRNRRAKRLGGRWRFRAGRGNLGGRGELPGTAV